MGHLTSRPQSAWAGSQLRDSAGLAPAFPTFFRPSAGNSHPGSDDIAMGEPCQAFLPLTRRALGLGQNHDSGIFVDLKIR